MSRRKKKYFLFIFAFICLANIYAYLKRGEHFEEKINFYIQDHEENQVDPLNFTSFKLDPKELICQPSLVKSILFIAFVIIAPHHFEKRALIRATWGNRNISSDFRIIFIVGQSRDETVNVLIEREYKLNQDILQIENFIDSYHKMTLKIMKSLKWISEHCSNAKYILRLNDDVIVNTRHLIRHFKNLTFKSNQIFGNLFHGTRPEREKHLKFYVPKHVYQKSTYDDYVDGMY